MNQPQDLAAIAALFADVAQAGSLALDPPALARPTRAPHWLPSRLKGMRLQAADGACVLLSRYGAQLLFWRTAAGEEQLVLNERTASSGALAGAGPATVEFTQFGPLRQSGQLEPLTPGGGAGTSLWQVLTSGVDAQGHAFASLGLEADQHTRAMWDQNFACELNLRLGGNQLHLELQVHNRSQRSWPFQAALQTPLRVSDGSQACLTGLCAAPGLHRSDPQAVSRLVLRDGARQLLVESQGFGATGLLDHASKHFTGPLCVITANLPSPMVLQPGECWRASQRLEVMERG
jgi:Aldose 1-epimerase